MTFLSPIAALIAAGITIPALLALYFLKRRRRLVPVASTLLWKKAIEDMQVNAPFQRLRRNLLLLLQLLALACLLFALARPAMEHSVAAGGRTVIVIDASGSMNATDGSPTRLDAAKDEALKVIDEAATAMVISFAQQARVVQPFTSDRALLRQAVRSIDATDQQGRIEPVLRLVEPFALEDDELVMMVFSDGRLSDQATQTLRGAELRFVQVGENETNNVAITAMSARRDLENPTQVAVFVRVTNYGSEKVDATVTLERDDAMWDVRRVPLPAGHGASLQFAVDAPGAVFVSASHDVDDALEADDSAALSVAPPRRAVVAVVTPGNAFLMRAARASGAAEVLEVRPDEYAAGPPDADVFIFDRYVPLQSPQRDSVYFGAAPPIDGLQLTDVEGGNHIILDWRRDHALMRYVAMDDLLLGETKRLVLPDGARTLMTADAGAAMAIVERDGVRHVVAGFDVLQTNWPMQVSFPVFIANAVDWLSLRGAADAGGGYAPGDAAVVETSRDAAAVTYFGPVTLEAKANAGRATLPVFRRAGVYYVDGDAPAPFDRVAVNMTGGDESDLTPADQLAIGAETAAAIKADSAQVRREVWRWFVLAVLGVLMVEWLVYVRRMHL